MTDLEVSVLNCCHTESTEPNNGGTDELEQLKEVESLMRLIVVGGVWVYAHETSLTCFPFFFFFDLSG